MATLIVDQSTEQGGLAYYGATARQLQTFTMPTGYDKIEYIQLKLKEYSVFDGTYYMYIYATSGGLPTGGVLASASVTTAQMVSGSYVWITFNNSDIIVTPGAKYAIVTYQPSAGTLSESALWGNTAVSVYPGGVAYYSLNSGASWTVAWGDWSFRVYGSQSATIPSVTSGATASITGVSCLIDNSNVTSDGGATITQRGVYYSKTDSTPDAGDYIKAVSGTTGIYDASLTSLSEGTFYYARAYAINSQGTAYGALRSFTTLKDIPDVTTTAATSITPITALLGGNVTSAHGATVTERGVVLDIATGPTTSDDKFAASTGGTGVYTVTATSLDPDTLYYIKAYAINSEGTAYGSEETFTTADVVEKWGQTFTAPNTGVLNKVDLYLKLTEGTTGSPTIRIYTDSTGQPGTLLDTVSGQAVTNTDWAWISYTLDVSVTSASVYWIVLETPYVVGDYQIGWGGNSAGGYASGEIHHKESSASTFTAISGDDAAFKAYVQPTLTTSYDVGMKYRKRYE